MLVKKAGHPTFISSILTPYYRASQLMRQFLIVSPPPTPQEALFDVWKDG